MLILRKFVVAVASFGCILGMAGSSSAQQKILSDVPPTVEYQYQLYYPRVWGWPGPGLSVGGSVPARGREGISSFYGVPFPVPLGAGAYMNPFAYSARLPGPMAFGLSSSNTPNAPSPTANLPVATPGVPSAALTPVPPNQNGTVPAIPAPRPVVTSSPDAIGRSVEIELWGDENVRQQNWTQAYINYRNAVLTADDRSEAHVRLGMTCVVLRRYPEAAGELKRALQIDPTIGQSADLLDRYLVTNDKSTRTEIVQDVARWARTDLRDQDHLFLLGAMLHLNGDPRSKEILEAALRIPGTQDHLLALLTPSAPPVELQSPETDGIVPPSPSSDIAPTLHQRPVAVK